MRRKNLQKERRGTRERGQPEGDGTLKAKRTEYFKREVVRQRLREWLATVPKAAERPKERMRPLKSHQ